MSFRFKDFQNVWNQGLPFLSIVPAGGGCMVWQSSTNEDTASPWWYDEGTPLSRTCFFKFPIWHRAKPRTLLTTFLILFSNRNHRSIVHACFYFNRNHRSTVSIGAIARISLFCSSIEDPWLVTAICNLFPTVLFDIQSELSLQVSAWELSISC